MAERYNFKYLPLVGKLPGKSMVEQTETAINELASVVYDNVGYVGNLAEEVQTANTNASNALDKATEALETSSRVYIKQIVAVDVNDYYDSELYYIDNDGSTNIPVRDRGFLEVKTNDDKTACEQVFIADSTGTPYYRHGVITEQTLGEETTYVVTWSSWYRVATTGYVQAELQDYLPLSGGTVTGVVNGVTPPNGDNSKKLATTEFVNAKAKAAIGYYNSVDKMRKSETAIVGRPCVTLGYYAPNDGGAAVYIIRQKKESDTDDGGSVIFLDNNNVAELIIEGAVNVKQFGAHGDGTTDDTTSINSALALGKNTVFPKATYLVSSPLILQPYTCVDLYGSIIVGSNADADIFLFSRELNPTESLTLRNGIIRGKYTNAIHFKGKNEWGHAPSNYVHKVRIDNILAYCDADAPDENTFLFLDTACKRLNITRCGAETKNCIISNGKTVETFINGCMLYATGTNGYAVKVYSDFTNGNGIVSSGWMYPEGIKIINCEIDNPKNTANAFTISDGFVTLVENCYIGCGMSITPPTNTTANTDIVIANNIIYNHTISIGDSKKTKNNIYRCRIENNVFDDSRVYIYESSTISVSNNTFYGSNTYDTAVYIGPHTDKIEVHDNCIYGNYKIGVICKNSPIEAAVYNINYNGIGNYGLYIEDDTKNTVYRHHIRGGEIPVMYTAIPANSEIDVGGTIASVTVSLAKGQTGYITGVINTTEDISNARIMVDAPGKMGILHGEGWSASFITVNNGTRRIPIQIPFKCTDDFAGTIKLINGINGGQSVKITTTYHSYFGVELT